LISSGDGGGGGALDRVPAAGRFRQQPVVGRDFQFPADGAHVGVERTHDALHGVGLQGRHDELADFRQGPQVLRPVRLAGGTGHQLVLEVAGHAVEVLGLDVSLPDGRAVLAQNRQQVFFPNSHTAAWHSFKAASEYQSSDFWAMSAGRICELVCSVSASVADRMARSVMP